MRGLSTNQTQSHGKGKGSAAPAVAAQAGDKGVLAHDLMAGLMGAVPTFGGTDVVVGFYGDQAFCNKKFNYVNIPQLPPGLIIPTQIAMEIRGFAAHEAAHLLFTDEEYMENGRTDEEKKDKLLHEVWNAIEDYMIERNWLLIYPGAHKNFTATEARCCHQYMAQYSQHPDMAKDLRIIAPVALTWCRSMHFGLKTNLSADCMKTLPAGLQQRVWDWFYEVVDVDTTEDCMEHARRIAEEIRQNPFDPNDPPANPNHNPLQPPAGQKQSQGGTGNGQGYGGSKGPGASSGGGSPGPGSNGQQGPTPYKVGHSLGAAYEDLKVDPPANGTMSFKVLSSTEDGPHAATLMNPDGVQIAQQAEAQVSSTIGVVSRVLKRSLQSIARDRWRGGRADGIIDDKRLSQVILGGAEIYKKKIRAPEIDTAVTILVDCSGSMGGAEIQICQQLALILYRSFAGTPIKFEIIGYTTGDVDDLPQHQQTMVNAIQQQDPNNPPVIRTVQLYEFKSFDAPHHVAMTTIGNMTSMLMGGTPTGDAILMAHERLSQRPERRHVLFVLTDGAPDDVDGCKKAVEAVESCGVTTVGFGIGTDAVRHAFRNWITINQASDLGAVVMTKLSNLLLDDKLVVGKRGIKAPSHIL
jgi:uncharacterized protein YegL/uncharacterized membrane protein YgcG